MTNLNESELRRLIDTIFKPTPEDAVLAVLVDVPNTHVPDNAKWRDRRRVAREWHMSLTAIKSDFGFRGVSLFYYENTGTHNGDLPGICYEYDGSPDRFDIEVVRAGNEFALAEVFSDSDILLVPAEFSPTAPLKNQAKHYRFRAASMPGFSRDMLPALKIDYDKVHGQVTNIKERLDKAMGIQMRFLARNREYDLYADVRYRQGHASSGLIRSPGEAWNLPSGEAFIVPYEGEREEPSRTQGRLPVQFGDEIVVYEIEENRARRISTSGAQSEVEKEKLRQEPAYGNIAEIGFGVLHPFGIKPVGETLLDEKLGLHIAFGRSDHFGGAVSPADFRNSKNVIHIDRVFIPEVQNRIQVASVVFLYEDGSKEQIMRDGRYLS